MNEKQHVVPDSTKEGGQVFYTEDTMSGGYPYFTPNVNSAERLTLAAAEKIVGEIQHPNKEDGHLNGLLTNAFAAMHILTPAIIDHPVNVEVSIFKITLQPVNTTDFVAQSTVREVQKKKGAIIESALAKLTVEERNALLGI